MFFFILGHQMVAGRNTPTHTCNKARKMLFRAELRIVEWEWTGRKCAHRQQWQPASSHVHGNVCSAERRRCYFCSIGFAHVQERDAQNLCDCRATHSCLWPPPDSITIFALWNSPQKLNPNPHFNTLGWTWRQTGSALAHMQKPPACDARCITSVNSFVWLKQPLHAGILDERSTVVAAADLEFISPYCNLRWVSWKDAAEGGGNLAQLAIADEGAGISLKPSHRITLRVREQNNRVFFCSLWFCESSERWEPCEGLYRTLSQCRGAISVNCQSQRRALSAGNEVTGK